MKILFGFQVLPCLATSELTLLGTIHLNQHNMLLESICGTIASSVTNRGKNLFALLSASGDVVY